MRLTRGIWVCGSGIDWIFLDDVAVSGARAATRHRQLQQPGRKIRPLQRTLARRALAQARFQECLYPWKKLGRGPARSVGRSWLSGLLCLGRAWRRPCAPSAWPGSFAQRFVWPASGSRLESGDSTSVCQSKPALPDVPGGCGPQRSCPAGEAGVPRPLHQGAQWALEPRWCVGGSRLPRPVRGRSPLVVAIGPAFQRVEFHATRLARDAANKRRGGNIPGLFHLFQPLCGPEFQSHAHALLRPH